MEVNGGSWPAERANNAAGSRRGFDLLLQDLAPKKGRGVKGAGWVEDALACGELEAPQTSSLAVPLAKFPPLSPRKWSICDPQGSQMLTGNKK